MNGANAAAANQEAEEQADLMGAGGQEEGENYYEAMV